MSPGVVAGFGPLEDRLSPRQHLGLERTAARQRGGQAQVRLAKPRSHFVVGHA